MEIFSLSFYKNEKTRLNRFELCFVEISSRSSNSKMAAFYLSLGLPWSPKTWIIIPIILSLGFISSWLLGSMFLRSSKYFLISPTVATEMVRSKLMKRKRKQFKMEISYLWYINFWSSWVALQDSWSVTLINYELYFLKHLKEQANKFRQLLLVWV